MNFAERLVGLYLRLNGFFLMPEFSTFSAGLKKGHAHVDLLGFRPKGTFEVHNNVVFPVDAMLFKTFGIFIKEPFKSEIAVVCEVRTNERGEFPNERRRDYASRMCGIPAIPMCADKTIVDVDYDDRAKGIRIGLIHAIRWIAARVQWLNWKGIPKSESWNWSEPALADFLVLHGLTPIPCEEEFKMMITPPPSGK